MLQLASGTGPAANGPPGDRQPADHAAGGQHAHVQKAVVDAGAPEQREPAGQHTYIADHDAVSVPDQWLGVIDAHRDLMGRPDEVGYRGHGIGEPAEVVLEQPRRAFDDGRVYAEPGHRHKRLAVGLGQVHVHVPARKAGGQRRSQIRRHS